MGANIGHHQHPPPPAKWNLFMCFVSISSGGFNTTHCLFKRDSKQRHLAGCFVLTVRDVIGQRLLWASAKCEATRNGADVRHKNNVSGICEREKCTWRSNDVEEEEEMESYRLVINLGFFFRLWPSWSTWHKSDLLILTCYIVSTFFRIVHNPATVRACACMCTRVCVCLHLFAFVCVYVHISLRVHVCLFSFV